jgi:hypothetical protein
MAVRFPAGFGVIGKARFAFAFAFQSPHMRTPLTVATSLFLG